MTVTIDNSAEVADPYAAPPEPSPELRALYLELTAALVRVEGILAPVVASARLAAKMLNAEGAAAHREAFESIADSTAWWLDWMADAGEDVMGNALARAGSLLAEFCPGCEIPTE